ncbi:MAG: zinc ribbon domain-containing protein [Bacilli bacterium]|nr:zinc ribbon domain-containing protein [Bacilli bacterium]
MITCPHCQHEAEEEMKYCPNCGQILVEEKVKPSTVVKEKMNVKYRFSYLCLSIMYICVFLALLWELLVERYILTGVDLNLIAFNIVAYLLNGAVTVAAILVVVCRNGSFFNEAGMTLCYTGTLLLGNFICFVLFPYMETREFWLEYRSYFPMSLCLACFILLLVFRRVSLQGLLYSVAILIDVSLEFSFGLMTKGVSVSTSLVAIVTNAVAFVDTIHLMFLLLMEASGGATSMVSFVIQKEFVFTKLFRQKRIK